MRHRRPDAQQTAGGITVGDSDLGGVVRSASGPEAGVWVIAETTELPTKFIKIVVTDDQGRYVLPELPKATYSVWVRGYGLVDSAEGARAPGKILDLTAVTAPTRGGGGRVLPGAVVVLDDEDSGQEPVPRHRAEGQRHVGQDAQPGEWLANIKSQGCGSCHQLGNKPTRTSIPSSASSRVLVGLDASHAGRPGGRDHGPQHRRARLADRAQEFRRLDRPHRRRRVAEVEAAAAAGRRAQRRRHAVGLGRADDYLHDEIATDRRNPTVNANGKIYGATEDSTDLCRCSIR